jgi:hypothetical protein
VWGIYDTGDSDETADAYILPRDGPLSEEWWVVSATSEMKRHKADWVKKLEAGGGTVIAGPFPNLDAAKAAWRVMFG